MPRPAPVETAPLTAPGEPSQAKPALPESRGGGVTLSQEPAPGAAPAPGSAGAAGSASSSRGRPSLVPTPADPLDVAEVTLPAQGRGGSRRHEQLGRRLRQPQGRVRNDRGALSPKPASNRPAGPLTVFVETDDAGFSYQAMVPVESAAASRPNLTPEIGFGRTPEGKAYQFLHRGPYETIDSTYETITAYLDAKGLVVKDVFVEEYLTDLTDRADDSLEINIFVQPQ